MSKKTLDVNICSSFIHNSQTLEIIQTSINRRMDKQNILDFYNRKPISSKNYFCSKGNLDRRSQT